MKTIQEMAREAQLPYFYQTGETANLKQLEAFAALVREDAQRKPLSDEDLRKLADKHLAYQPESYEVSGVFALARCVEAAHGIGDNT